MEAAHMAMEATKKTFEDTIADKNEVIKDLRAESERLEAETGKLEKLLVTSRKEDEEKEEKHRQLVKSVQVQLQGSQEAVAKLEARAAEAEAGKDSAEAAKAELGAQLKEQDEAQQLTEPEAWELVTSRAVQHVPFEDQPPGDDPLFAAEKWCHCCWAEDNRPIEVDVFDEKQRGVVPTENAMSDPSQDCPQTYMVKLRKGSLSIDKTDVWCVVIKEVTGPLAEWNSEHPSDHQVRILDRIVQVNGKKITGADVDRHLEDKSNSELLLALQRPAERKVTLQRPGKLGIDLQYRKASCKPWLTNITEGLVLRWNQENSNHLVTAHDRLVSAWR
ncbi:unnamed protein product [Effrenium voratum]|nr:unnamed protein product [Effrenium voratum]